MSLLSPNRNRAQRHLTDDAFAELWSAAAASGEPVADPHLAACAQCRARYAAFTGWLDRIHDDAVGEADEAFPAERLAAQQAQVMRRLEALERPARVIAFPRFARPSPRRRGTRSAGWRPRQRRASSSAWRPGSSSTCAACLRRRRTAPTQQNARLTTTQPVGAPSVVPASLSSVSDETLFFGGDPARTTGRLPMLQAMDDITPRARDLERPR